MVFADGSAMKVDVPKAKSSYTIGSSPLTVVIRSDSSVLVDGKILTMRELESKIRSHLKTNPAVVLRGDSKASVSALVAVMDCAKMCGVREIYVSADKK